MSERVLVVPTAVFHAAGLFQGFSPRADHYLPRLLTGEHLAYRPRDEVETDPSFKQIIPYVIMAHGGRVLSYVRGKRAGEQRLLGQRSIGVGGHINPADDLPLFNADFREAWHEYPETLLPDIQLYRLGEGPFAADAGKIKQSRILSAA